MLDSFVWPTVSGWDNIDDLIFMQGGAPPHFALNVRAWLDQHFQVDGWVDADLMNGLREAQILHRVIFTCGVTQKRKCTRQNLAHWKIWR